LISTQVASLVNDFFLFDIDLITPTCLVRWDPHRTLIAQVVFSMAGLLCFVPVVCKFAASCVGLPPSEWRAHGRRQFDFQTGPLGERLAQAINDCLSLIDVMAPGMCYNALALMRCEEADEHGVRYVMDDPGVRCDSRYHYGVVALAVLSLLGASIAVPLAVYCEIRREYRETGGVHGAEIQAKLGGFFDSYRPPHHNYYVNKSIFNVVLSVIATRVPSSPVQLALLLMSLVLFWVHHEHCRPYIHPATNHLESIGFLFAFFMTCCAVVLEVAHFSHYFVHILVVTEALFVLRVAFATTVTAAEVEATSEGEQFLKETLLDAFGDGAPATQSGGGLESLRGGAGALRGGLARAGSTLDLSGPRKAGLSFTSLKQTALDGAARALAKGSAREREELAQELLDEKGELFNTLNPIGFSAVARAMRDSPEGATRAGLARFLRISDALGPFISDTSPMSTPARMSTAEPRPESIRVATDSARSWTRRILLASPRRASRRRRRNSASKRSGL